MQKQYDLIVIGGGVLGTFHAYHALLKGLRVALIEKDIQPMGATVRNFGQVVPSGMDSKWQAYGRRSLEIYKNIQSEHDISARLNGTVYIASNEEELQLLEELYSINQRNSYASSLLTKEECLKKYPGLQNDYVVAGLFFPEEITVESRVMISRLQKYLVDKFSLEIIYNLNVLHCEPLNGRVEVMTSLHKTLWASKVIICNGNDFKTLYPEVFNASDLEVCKLQMMQTKPQKNYRLPGSILTGWTIRRYESFSECPSYKEIKAREPETSYQKKWGVHILFKQAADGSVIIGDSHEYADAENADSLGFDLNMELDNFMIEEAKKIIALPDYEIAQRWYGTYSQCKHNDIFTHNVNDNIHIVTGIGGKGMTGSAGFAEDNIESIYN
ncbi:TIGR03364 family FAD-dependent oxidoreductase [Zhouia spongiae]|uniref:TIGR03364 family FAD-dependent oxidoreductase n=1 Tax=Zhouia spongiae TaxID=2202721 RepID=A0ABY3YLM5_9FLAO|nr:TIGR03364 family FAD-dependent oxidoreductase [Zhouia spongiae]UNY98499.1 TIGR03364 family FAD-dependent oxidoreductase [Zhouia spongiae]